MIHIEHLDFGYKPFQRLFEDFSLSLEQGGIVGLLGKNGEGKSTLMKLLSGQLFARRGKLSVLGYDPRSRQVPFLQQVYLLPEEVAMPSIRIEKYLSSLAPFYPTYDAHRAQEILREFELSPEMNLGRLSLGQRKKAAITFALSLRSTILLMDEPTNGLDIPSKSAFRRLVAGYTSELDQLVIISTHQIRDLDMLLHRLLILDHNQIICNHSIETLSHVLKCGICTEHNISQALYYESSVAGEVGLFPCSAEVEHSLGFSMELFFSAMIASSRQGIEQYLSTSL